ncbi:hypothetical protein C8F04DRAFT_1273828 [Mycena alexandri]|uniref:Uncharacterized protein n=1 Tax=Mycena alexandri TaxID=1745969 RepID=A0AAD6S7P3_9AGAR|nr:hypothetical protein C8F04DRAFT_1273828 [Mycena alexandri]
MNFVMDAWNTLKVLRQAALLAAERLDALRLFELHMAVVEDLSRQHATEVGAWSRMPRKTTKPAGGGPPESVYQHKLTKVLTINNMVASMVAEEREKARREERYEARTSVAQWLHDGITIARLDYRESPSPDTWDTITKTRDDLNRDLKSFRERQREIYPRLKLSALDVDEPELTAIQLPSDSELREGEIQLRCTQANNGILAVRAASLALSAAVMMKEFEIKMYNVHLGHMAKDAVEPYPPLTARDTRRKETHLHRAKGDSQLFDGTAWYLQSGVTISSAAVTSTLSPSNTEQDDEPQLLAGYQDTQALSSLGFKQTQRAPKRLRDIAPDDVVVESSSSSDAEGSDLEMSPSKQGMGKQGKGKGKKKKTKKKQPDGWIWLENLTRGQSLSDAKLAEYKRESDQVQWFRAEVEMYRWLEHYERKHAELWRVIKRFRRDSVVWMGLGDREAERNGGLNGAVTFARMQAAMHHRLAYNADVIYKSANSGAHHDRVSATSFDELVSKIDGWRDVVFKWMDDMGIHRAYKNF